MTKEVALDDVRLREARDAELLVAVGRGDDGAGGGEDEVGDEANVTEEKLAITFGRFCGRGVSSVVENEGVARRGGVGKKRFGRSEERMDCVSVQFPPA